MFIISKTESKLTAKLKFDFHHLIFYQFMAILLSVAAWLFFHRKHKTDLVAMVIMFENKIICRKNENQILIQAQIQILGDHEIDNKTRVLLHVKYSYLTRTNVGPIILRNIHYAGNSLAVICYWNNRKQNIFLWILIERNNKWTDLKSMNHNRVADDKKFLVPNLKIKKNFFARQSGSLKKDMR